MRFDARYIAQGLDLGDRPTARMVARRRQRVPDWERVAMLAARVKGVWGL